MSVFLQKRSRNVFFHILFDGTIYADQGKRPDLKKQNNPEREPDHHSKKGMKENKNRVKIHAADTNGGSGNQRT